MGKVRIVTDSSAHFLNPDVVRRFGIEVVPLTLRLAGQSFREGVDLDAESFLKLMNRHNQPVALEAPPVEAFAEVYQRLNAETDQILSLHVSRQISPTWDHARAASRTLLGRCEIVPLDSMTISAGLALLVETAAAAAERGAPIAEVVRLVRAALPRVYTVLYVETLDTLRHNGVLSEAQAVLGTMLDIKPFLTVEEGELIAMEKARTEVNAIDKLVEFVTEFGEMERLIVLQNTPYPTERTHLLQERLAVEMPGRDFPVMMYGPSLAALVGSDALGVVVYEAADAEDD